MSPSTAGTSAATIVNFIIYFGFLNKSEIDIETNLWLGVGPVNSIRRKKTKGLRNNSITGLWLYRRDGVFNFLLNTGLQ